MMLRFSVFFGAIFFLFSHALTESVESEVDVNEVSYLYSTRSLLVYKEGQEKYTLFNDSLLVHENIDYHYGKGLAFFQPHMAAISCVPLRSSGSKPETVVEVNTAKNEIVSVFAVDWVHNRIYWSTWGYERGIKSTVESADLSGGDRKVLVVTNATLPSGMAVDPFAGKLFWIHDLVKIVSCNLDGSGFKTLVSVDQNIDVVTRIKLDLANKRIFYVHTENSAWSGKFYVKSADYDGGRPGQPYVLDKTTENYRRDVRSLDLVQGRLFVFSGLYDRATDRVKSFVLHSLRNNTVEGKKMFTDAGVLEDGSDPAVATLHARLVHPELQPSSEPKRKEEK